MSDEPVKRGPGRPRKNPKTETTGPETGSRKVRVAHGILIPKPKR
jgi:hypothetical protein